MYNHESAEKKLTPNSKFKPEIRINDRYLKLASRETFRSQFHVERESSSRIIMFTNVTYITEFG